MQPPQRQQQQQRHLHQAAAAEPPGLTPEEDALVQALQYAESADELSGLVRSLQRAHRPHPALSRHALSAAARLGAAGELGAPLRGLLAEALPRMDARQLGSLLDSLLLFDDAPPSREAGAAAGRPAGEAPGPARRRPGGGGGGAGGGGAFGGGGGPVEGVVAPREVAQLLRER